jgi:peptidoglycan hydrolase CwlO-like protein
MKTEIGLMVIATLIAATAPLTCASTQPTPAVAVAQQPPEDEEADETGLVTELEEKDCDKAIESIQEQSSRIDDRMSEIQKDLKELKKRKKIKKVTKKKIKTKKIIDK